MAVKAGLSCTIEQKWVFWNKNSNKSVDITNIFTSQESAFSEDISLLELKEKRTKEKKAIRLEQKKVK